MMKFLSALVAAALACAPASAQRVNALPVSTSVHPTDQVVAISGSGCDTATLPCTMVKIPANQIAGYVATDPAITGVYQAIADPARSAAKWTSARTVTATGDVSWTLSLDGSANATASSSLSATGVSAGSYGGPLAIPTLTVDAKGRISSAGSIALGTVPVVQGGTGATTVAGALSALGVSASGTDPAFAKLTGAAFTGAISATNLSGVNTGDQTSVSGNAGTATRLASGRTLALSGDVAWTSPPFDGSANVSAAATLASTGVVAGSYTNANLTVDAKGRITAASNGTAGGGGSGTVTSVSVATANGFSGTVANPSTTPAITIVAGALTPTSVAATGTVTGSNLSGTNTGDQTSVTGNAGTATKLATARTIAITGDLAYTSPAFDGSAAVTAAGTLATVNSNVGTYGGAGGVPSVTVNAKGLVTAASQATLGIAGGGTGRTTAMPVLIATGGNGTSSGAVTLNQAFKTIPLTTIVIDSASGYNTSTGIYIVPETGVYFITAKMRLLDAQFIAGVNYGIGVDTATADSTSFLWLTTTSASLRQGIVNTRLYSATAGDQLRLYGFYDNANGTMISSAEIDIVRVR